MFRRVSAVIAVVALLVPLAAVQAGSAAAACDRDAAELIPPAGKAHLGAYVYAGNELGLSQPEALESQIGHQLGINHSFQHGAPSVLTARIQADIDAGRIPMISWAAGDQAELGKIDLGQKDDWIDAQAQALAAFCVPMFLRFTWEFDLRYTDTALFVRVWQRVRDHFRTVAPNVAFVWNPTWRAFSETDKAVPFYPGNDYVDWVAADGYARPKPDKPEYHYRAFADMFADAHAFAVSHGKPFMVGETGVHRDEADPRQASWLNTTRTVVKAQYPALKAFLYFHVDGDDLDNHWRVTVPPGGPALQAFRAYATDPFFNP
ncbi:MAG TPA: glycosyl hydrolase [Kribbella sp.]|uniref:glycoside hydrolase family 26 protein n=1 Tax=Kribbella sp. TaxID=1871183 RepID=UPI002D79EF46|nr:glycosyl hydrolase [Kribbella sp.]HET6297703.1 glycosyl hydrolase [Kribbella sp.]